MFDTCRDPNTIVIYVNFQNLIISDDEIVKWEIKEIFAYPHREAIKLKSFTNLKRSKINPHDLPDIYKFDSIANLMKYINGL